METMELSCKFGIGQMARLTAFLASDENYMRTENQSQTPVATLEKCERDGHRLNVTLRVMVSHDTRKYSGGDWEPNFLPLSYLAKLCAAIGYFPADELPRASIDGQVDDLALSVRVKNILKAEGIYSIEQLIVHTETKLLCLSNIGRKSVKEISVALSVRGLALGSS